MTYPDLHALGWNAEFLRQRVEANYLAGAVLMPERVTVERLLEAKRQRQLSMEDLRDAFGVSYEMAAHRFTNLATEHLELPVHFMKVHESGTLVKAYKKLRPQGKKHVEAAMPRIGAMLAANGC